MFKYIKIGNKLNFIEKRIKTNKYNGNTEFRKYFGQLLKMDKLAESWRVRLKNGKIVVQNTIKQLIFNNY